MPIVSIAGKKVYFAHVPKCAGTAIELYLEKQFGPLAFRDGQFYRRPQRRRWTRSSPQHVDAEAISVLFPDGFFDASFAVVRSPVARIVSAFRFQRDIEGTVGADVSLAGWLEKVHRKRNTSPWQFDNHTRTMDEIVPQGARCFRLEDGLDAVVAWLQDLAGPGHDLPLQIEPRNVLDKRLEFEGKPVRPVVPNQEELALIAKHYAADYTRFGYDTATGRPLAL